MISLLKLSKNHTDDHKTLMFMKHFRFSIFTVDPTMPDHWRVEALQTFVDMVIEEIDRTSFDALHLLKCTNPEMVDFLNEHQHVFSLEVVEKTLEASCSFTNAGDEAMFKMKFL